VHFTAFSWGGGVFSGHGVYLVQLRFPRFYSRKQRKCVVME